jgi:hypothetical protein
MSHSEAQPPSLPNQDAPQITGASLVRDVRTGETVTADAWVDRHAAAEQRPRAECLDALMNAIGRGDIVAVP